MNRLVNDYLVYRWRYVFGYLAIVIGILWLLMYAALQMPDGITSEEVSSAVCSSSLSANVFSTDALVDYPYHVVQYGSMQLFGVSTTSIKLPSILFAIIAIVGMLLLLRLWFNESIAIITVIVAITTSQLLFTAQEGTPNVMYIVWPIWLIAAATMIARTKHKVYGFVWKIVLAIVAALSLYTPLSIYMLIGIAVAAFAHPHLRYIILHLSRKKLAIALCASTVFLLPLIIGIVQQPSIALRLLGVPTSGIDWSKNAHALFEQYFGILPSQSPEVQSTMYGFGTLVIILLGLIRLFTTKYTGRSYIISFWLVAIIPMLLLNPTRTALSFVPVMLLIGYGVHYLLRLWYDLFPRNPYARFIGLLPLTILVSSLIFSGIDRYIYGSHYSPQVALQYSQDLNLLHRQLEHITGPVLIVAGQSEMSFYNIVAHGRPNIVVDQELPANAVSYTKVILTHNAANDLMLRYRIPAQHVIITDSMSTDADRFYTYSPLQQPAKQ